LVYPVADIDVRVRVLNGPQGLRIAASALPKLEGEWRRYRLEQARNFALSMSPDYVVLEESVGEVTVLGYAFPTDVLAGEAAFRATVEALQLYSELYGAYPWESLSLVEADFLHGMEYQGLHYLSRGFYNLYTGTARDYLTAIAAHETAHQWWYGLVGNDQAMEPWLDETLCTYSERLFYENVHPEDLDWWWEARVDFYKPEGKVDSALYETGGYRPYVNAVYLRGALFLEDLRALMGDADFFHFLNDYAQENSRQLATSADFFALLKDHTDEDLNGLLREYFK
jgi:aminopeptidase N